MGVGVAAAVPVKVGVGVTAAVLVKVGVGVTALFVLVKVGVGVTALFVLVKVGVGVTALFVFFIVGVAVMLGYSPMPKLQVGYSYDITINKLASVSRGSHEMMVKYCYFIPPPPKTKARHPRML